MPCQYTLDKSRTHYEVVDLTGATTTTVIQVQQCSTVRVDLIFNTVADATPVPELWTGNDSGGADLAEVLPANFTALTKASGTTAVRTIEFCPDKEYFQIQWPGNDADNAHVLVTQHHCRTSVPYDETDGNHLANKVTI